MSYHIYPVMRTEPFCDDYIVKVNGESAELNTARVSAVPFNRRWPGHQRQIEQTEPAQFLSLETDEPLNFEIIPKKPFECVNIRPKSLGIVPELENGVMNVKNMADGTSEPVSFANAIEYFKNK